MSDFEFLFGFYGLLFGLIVAEVAVKFADAIDAHGSRPLGWLTPLLAVFVLLDACSFWLWAWSVRDFVQVSWRVVFVGLIVSFTYFLAAALIFPRSKSDYPGLDEHYWIRKRLVVGGVLLVQAPFMVWQLSRAMPAWNDWWFYFYQLPYFAALIALLFTRRKQTDLLLLAVLIANLFASGLDLLPSSEWGKELGISFSEQPSTTRAAAPR